MKLGKNRVNLGDIEVCMKQRCACSRKEAPQYKSKKNPNGCTNAMCSGFTRLDWGCWKIRIGHKPIRVCLDDCNCECHAVVGDKYE